MRKIEPLTDPSLLLSSSFSSIDLPILDSWWPVLYFSLSCTLIPFPPPLLQNHHLHPYVMCLLINKLKERSRHTHMCTDTGVKEPVMRLPRIRMDAVAVLFVVLVVGKAAKGKRKSRRSGDSNGSKGRKERNSGNGTILLPPKKREELCIRIDLSLFIPSDFAFFSNISASFYIQHTFLAGTVSSTDPSLFIPSLLLQS